MKAIKFFGILMFISTMSISCAGQDKTTESTSVSQSDDVHVYYFHNERRCATCRAVEAESRKAVKALYGDKVSFAAYNLDNEEGEKMGKEVGTDVQSLLVISGNNKIDITNEGFLYARNEPEKLKQVIKEKVDPLL